MSSPSISLNNNFTPTKPFELTVNEGRKKFIKSFFHRQKTLEEKIGFKSVDPCSTGVVIPSTVQSPALSKTFLLTEAMEFIDTVCVRAQNTENTAKLISKLVKLILVDSREKIFQIDFVFNELFADYLKIDPLCKKDAKKFETIREKLKRQFYCCLDKKPIDLVCQKYYKKQHPISKSIILY